MSLLVQNWILPESAVDRTATGRRAAVKSIEYGITCLACGDDVGHIVTGSLVLDASHGTTPSQTGADLRCGRCGGSVYFEIVDTDRFTDSPAELVRKLAGNAVQRPA
jgi:hypothetical protein